MSMRDRAMVIDQLCAKVNQLYDESTAMDLSENTDLAMAIGELRSLVWVLGKEKNKGLFDKIKDQDVDNDV